MHSNDLVRALGVGGNVGDGDGGGVGGEEGSRLAHGVKLLKKGEFELRILSGGLNRVRWRNGKEWRNTPR